MSSEPRHEDLEAAIAADPTQVDSYLVYGDWLQARGDPQGTLIAAMHRARTDSGVKVDGPIRRYRSTMGFGRGLELTWQLGFIESIRVVTKDAAALGKLLSTRAACAVQGITFTKTSAQLLEAPEVLLPRSLRYLALKGNRVTNLVKLEGLPWLRALALHGTTKIRDLAPLATLPSLEQADLAGARAADLAQLSSLTALEALRLPGQGVRDLRPLAPLTGLTSLKGRIKQVSDLEPLQALTRLKTLALVGATRVKSLKPLGTLTALEQLELSYRESATDLGFIVPLTNLRRLCCNNTTVDNIAPLRSLDRLARLELQSCHELIDISPLRAITSLREIDLRFSERIRDVTPLHGMERLEDVDVVYTGVADGARKSLEASLPSFKRRTSYTSLYCEETLDVGSPDVTGRW